MLLCLISLSSFAQTGSHWEIVRADYGYGNNWLNVTEQVRSLVQGDSLNFVVDGDTLGAPARRGRNRTLRLQLKDNQGNSRQVNYRDNQRVNLPIYAPYQTSLHINRAI